MDGERIESNNSEEENTFKKEIERLFDVCRRIVSIMKSKKNISKNNPVYYSLEQFIQTYERLGPTDTLIIFECFYSKNRLKILTKSDSWLKSGPNSILEFPCKKTKNKKAIYLQAFYRDALTLSKEAEDKVTNQGIVDEANNVFLPELITHILLRIFLLVCSDDDKEIIKNYLSDIESDLPDLDDKETLPNTQNLGIIGDVIKNLNLNKLIESGTGEDLNLGNMGEMLNTFINSENSKNVFNKVANKFKGINSIEEIAGTVGDLIADKELHESIKNLIPLPASDHEVDNMIKEAERKLLEETPALCTSESCSEHQNEEE